MTNRKSPSEALHTWLMAAGVVAAIQLALAMTGNSAILRGTLFDPDCYMHLQRALNLMTGGAWQETIDPRINAPDGFAIHWTVLFDMLLAAGAEPLRLFGFDPQAALYAWGTAISPVLLMLALFPLAWGTQGRLSRAGFLWLTVLLFTEPEFSGGFLAGRPDHQSLVLGLLVVQLGWLYAFFDGRAGTRWALVAGVLAGIQMCTSVEALLTILLVVAGLVSAWVFYGVRSLKVLAVYLGGCVATMLAWLLWEHGGFLLHPSYDRVSVVHLIALGSGFVCFGVLAFMEERGALVPGRRPAAAGLAAAAAAAITATVFPDFFLGPWQHLDPAVIAWHREISELQPLLPTDLKHLEMFLAQFTAPLLGLPLVIHRLWRGPLQDRPVMLVSLFGFVLFGSLALAQMRWSGEMQAVMLLPWTLTTIAVMKSEIGIVLAKVKIPLRTFGLSGALLLQLLSAAFAYSGPERFTTHPAGACAWRDGIGALSKIAPPGSIVMAQLWQGPEILWRTKLRVVAGPYEMPSALIDTEAFLRGDERSARAVALRRHVDFVLVCPREARHGFDARLARGTSPAWLKPVPLRGSASAFRLYRVDF